jgi:hypothetical protein
MKAGVRPSAVDGWFPLGAVPDDEQDLVVSLVWLEPRIADPPFGVVALLAHRAASLLGLPDSLAEGSEDRVESSESLLLSGERMPALACWVVRANLSELSRLIEIADRPVSSAPSLPAFLEGGVVEVAVIS